MHNSDLKLLCCIIENPKIELLSGIVIAIAVTKTSSFTTKKPKELFT